MSGGDEVVTSPQAIPSPVCPPKEDGFFVTLLPPEAARTWSSPWKPDHTPDPLDPIRKEIDDADRQLIQVLARRFDAVKRVGQLKHNEADQPILDTERERRVQAAWVQDAETLGLSAPFARRVLKEILNHSRRMQEALIQDRKGPGRHIRCGYQGQAGSYGALAASHLLAHGPPGKHLIGYGTFQEVGKALINGEVDYGLLPVENSIGGSIADVNRIICDNALHIVDEEVWQVEHVLAVPPRVGARRPAADPQPPGRPDPVRDLPVQPGGGALGNPGPTPPPPRPPCLEGPARERRNRRHLLRGGGQPVRPGRLARSLADRECNETRFLLLARDPETPDQRLPCKTSMLFRVNHHEGSLVRALDVFAEARVNLTRIESRPLPDMPWEYLFFVDVEGHLEAPEPGRGPGQAALLLHQPAPAGQLPLPHPQAGQPPGRRAAGARRGAGRRPASAEPAARPQAPGPAAPGHRPRRRGAAGRRPLRAHLRPLRGGEPGADPGRRAHGPAPTAPPSSGAAPSSPAPRPTPSRAWAWRACATCARRAASSSCPRSPKCSPSRTSPR